ncbi:MAG: hypothetical protein Unbinned6354contig1000_37 [Prokaryotic dsDNA virus sp.]|nr:hypothetical protein [Cytophagaceae bacterium]QDP54334.1 MAG: hypothetical protein Unbinned6354contig1000_37 [Prokaryotic dsDNA virus sp.]|tara:strand:- start:4531 stop:5343 length:813 start_codon:yes stop_codon:yes gene_type:complete
MKISLTELEGFTPSDDLIRRFIFNAPCGIERVDLAELMGEYYRGTSHPQEMRLTLEDFVTMASYLLEPVDLVCLATDLAGMALNGTKIESHIGLRDSFQEAHRSILKAKSWIKIGSLSSAGAAECAYEECRYCYANAKCRESELIYYACSEAAHAAHHAHHDKRTQLVNNVMNVIEAVANMNDFYIYRVHERVYKMISGKSAEEQKPLRGSPILKWAAVSMITLFWVAVWMTLGVCFILDIQTTNKDFTLIFGGLTFYSVWKTLKYFKLD